MDSKSPVKSIECNMRHIAIGHRSHSNVYVVEYTALCNIDMIYAT